MMENIIGKPKEYFQEEESHWLSVSDLMAGLMMVFLFISIVLMRNALIERDKVKEIAAAYQDNKVKIYDALINEFGNDLIIWDAEITKDNLSFNFKAPEVLFGIGKTTIKPKFQEILANFSPRYLKVINDFRESIEEVRIEGHTDSHWGSGVSNDAAYFNNMKLSQGRTRSVLSYLYQSEKSQQEQEWIKKNVAAVGYSSAKRIMEYGIEDAQASRRVTFRIITNSEIQILKIIGE